MTQKKANHTMTKYFSIEIDDNWIVDGFEFSPDTIKQCILDASLIHAYASEIKVKEVKWPENARQFYPTEKHD